MRPRASVIVPVHDRAELTRRCLDILLAGLPDRNSEVIVVDDASTDSTSALLESYGDAIRSIAMPDNVGYARACNEGAAVAAGEALIFLNNDTEPEPGWLEALLDHADAHRRAAVIGAKLLYPTGAVQHAGVVIGQDGYPHNLYAGLPADHPAVNRPRRLQAVTGACMLVRRGAFESAGGFDTGFVNSLEDVDLCLRIGEAGGEIGYCPAAVVVHLESASRGRLDRFERSLRLYRERWRERVHRDDLEIYAEDGLLEVEYAESYPVRLTVSPRLAVIDGGREAEAEALLETYARQVSDLLGEAVRLTALTGVELEAPPAVEVQRTGAELDHCAFIAEANRIEEEIHALQQRLEGAGASLDPGARLPFTATRRLGYRRLVERVRAAVDENVPEGATVLVVSRGDRELVELGSRRGRHFPQGPDGGYLGHHPRNSEDAVARLEALREDGAEYLVIPAASRWWLEHYSGFAEHLGDCYGGLDLDVCSIYRLAGDRQPTAGERVG